MKTPSEIFVNPKKLSYTEETLFSLIRALEEGGYDIVCAERLTLKFKNGFVKKDIFFENLNQILPESVLSVPKEPEAFIKERWNPLNGLFVAKKSLLHSLHTKDYEDVDELLRYCFKHNYKIFILGGTEAIETITPHLGVLLRKSNNVVSKIKQVLKEIVVSNFYLRKIFLRITYILGNIRSVFKNKERRKRYYETIEQSKIKKELVLHLSYGGLGDCLVFTSLPRLLKEQYGVDFYLDEKTKDIFRQHDIFKLCFEMNPFFKGFKTSENVFEYGHFSQDMSLRTFFTDKYGENICEQVERQFNVKGNGVPELFYKPKFLSEYTNTIFVDTNWFSGKKWGLYNDQSLLEKEIQNSKLENTNARVEFSTPTRQDIFTYIDKIFSSWKFISFFSGGNVLAATLKKEKVTIILPENIEGGSMYSFLFPRSHNTYIRNGSLKGYVIP